MTHAAAGGGAERNLKRTGPETVLADVARVGLGALCIEEISMRLPPETRAAARTRLDFGAVNMATAAHAIQRISEATGILHATVFRIARHLREAEGKDLWPLGATGAPSRGREVVVYPRHLVSLLLGLSVTPITSVAEHAVWLRGLTAQTNKVSKPLLPGNHLSEALEHHLDSPDNPFVKPLTVSIARFGSRLPSVKIYSGDLDVCYYFPTWDQKDEALTPIPEAAPFTTFEIRQPLIDVAAELWADTKMHLIKTPPALHRRLI